MTEREPTPCPWVLVLGLALGGVHCRSSSEALPAQPGAVPHAADERALPSGGAPDPRSAPRALRVASWNLHWLHRDNQRGPVKRKDADYERLRQYARRLGADVVAVQEVDGEPALARVFDPSEYDHHVTRGRDVQLVGFAYRKSLSVQVHPDLDALDVGGVRSGADITVYVNGTSLRLLNVHLKSDCFSAPLESARAACVKLRAQLPVLEQWIDTRAAAGEPFLVLGDFNRRLNASDPFYTELDDGSPPNADLTLVSDGQRSTCWGGKYPELIDHLLLSRNAAPWVRAGSFSQLQYGPAQAPYQRTLSDHCPISFVLVPVAGGGVAVPPPVAPGAAAPGASPAAPSRPSSAAAAPPRAAASPPIKGNINARRHKLYHLPGCPSYEATRIDESRGERWFATEAEAIDAGWRRAPGCAR